MLVPIILESDKTTVSVGTGNNEYYPLYLLMLRLQTIKAIVDSHSFKSPKSDEPRRVQVLDLYCLTRFETEGSSKGIVY